MNQVGADICRDFSRSSKIEWLQTNGTGAFAMGTVAGVNTRRYHALLVASLKPPSDRYVLLSRVEEEINGRELGVCQYPGIVTPRGFELLEAFQTDPCATWRFRVDHVLLEKQVCLVDRCQAVALRYRCDRALTLRVRPFLAYRDYHSLGHARSDIFGALPHLDFHHRGKFEPGANWYYNVEYLEELDRGLDFREDLYSPGVIALDLRPGEWCEIRASIGPVSGESASSFSFLARRSDGRPTVIAGFPWFTDWGRDTMISLPGLLISKGRLREAREIIEAFLAHMKQGLIPNRFPDAGDTPEYNTVDATLWMFQTVRAWLDAGGDRAFLRNTFYPAAKEIIAWHRRGTLFGIGVDPGDQLLAHGPQLTWMDTKFTPRAGKAVEINALWHGALCLMAEWATEFGDNTDFGEQADRVRESFRAKFWNEKRECLRDLTGDEKIRPNQIFAVSLPYELLDKREQQAVVRAVHRDLLTPVGLRTLDPGDADYRPRYQGPPEQRDAAYHQGTVWPWLLGPFVDAYLMACGRTAKNLAYCRGLIDRLEAEAAREGCLGAIAEIYDADEPRHPRGCPAQAWSMAEVDRLKATYFSK
ncbi:MAG TPA: amylo-alpha-1,6-glucosidase [Bryobacteraceae bacterium]|nr:amylo-alpha-1,6-glucosidase [Bryobacteraceae bacterium]